MTPCIEWNRARSADGYGQTFRSGKVVYVHRLTWERAYGPIPVGMFVCHRCDNRACYNLNHLFLGTVADNNRDMRAKGRGSAPPIHLGESNPASRLTAEQVRAIRDDHRILRLVAADYGVSISTVSVIRRGEKWRSVA